MIVSQGLGRFYDLGRGQISAVAGLPDPRPHPWLEPMLSASAAGQGGGVCSIDLDVQGIVCAACVWLMNETFRRRGGDGIVVNPALGTARLRYTPGRFDVEAWVSEIEAFGYQLGPPRKSSTKGSLELPLRLGLSAALTINVMLFSFSFYFGLAPADGEVFTLFSRLSLLLSTLVVLIGGWPFFRAAVRGLRSRVLHLDLPIALGIVLVYGSSVAQARGGRSDFAYFDTLNVFITLMLVGRWLQRRIIEKNRHALLEDDGADGLVARRRVGSSLEVVPAATVRAGDELVVAPGELVPVDATLVGQLAQLSTDWINGESTPCTVVSGGPIPAGSFNAGRSAFCATATTSFKDSPLVSLLRQTKPGASQGERGFWHALARRWSAQVLVISAAGFLVWLPRGLDSALSVAAALLVITCPCAIGIALPLAWEVTQARLRRAGFFIRSDSLLERLTQVRTVVFDKTGTLTLGRLELDEPAAIDALDLTSRDVAFNLASRSNHPVSQALSRALGRAGARFDAAAEVIETPGTGLSWQRADGHWALGRAGLTLDERPVAAFAMHEALRADALTELSALRARGLAVWLLSGDRPDRVARLAAGLGVPADQALGGLLPEQKEAQVKRLGSDRTLYLGDGVNDALAFAASLCAGTPAIDRPVMPGRSDFFMVGEGLAPLRAALERAAHLRKVVRRVLAASLTYNVAAVGCCLLGLMTPLRAAISMPLSSLSLIALTLYSLKAPSPQATRSVPAEVNA